MRWLGGVVGRRVIGSSICEKESVIDRNGTDGYENERIWRHRLKGLLIVHME